jgi:hypothetical protein
MLKVLTHMTEQQTCYTCVEKYSKLLFERDISGGALSPIAKAPDQFFKHLLVNAKLIVNPFRMAGQ